MQQTERWGAAAGMAALPFGALAAWLCWRGYLVPDARTGWMLFWLCGALLTAVLCALPPWSEQPEQPGGWRRVSRRSAPLQGLALPLAAACVLCLLGALGLLCLPLPRPFAALWCGGLAAALVWLLLCLLALVCAFLPE